jgi:hypothetical protein
MLGLFKYGQDDFEEDILEEHKKKMKSFYITFGILAFIIFNLIMYFLIAY